LAWAHSRLATCSRLFAVGRVWVKPATSRLRVRYSTNWTAALRLVYYFVETKCSYVYICSMFLLLFCYCVGSAWLDSNLVGNRHSVVACRTRHSARSSGKLHASESHVSTLCWHTWTALHRTTLNKQRTRTVTDHRCDHRGTNKIVRVWTHHL